MKKNIIALIMIGGQSKRLGGGIKSFLVFNKKSIFERILLKLSPQIENIIINSNLEDQRLNNYKLTIIKDLKKGYLGPLAGIHSAMKWIINFAPEIDWLITIPGDTPFIPNDLILRFQKKISTNLKIILAQSNKKIHPVIGLWHVSLLKSLENELNKGTRKILNWAEKHPLGFINYKYEKYDPFFNINSKEDLKKASIIENNFFLKKNEKL